MAPTVRAQNVWQSEGGDDFLQLKSSAGAIQSWIDSTGTGQGGLAAPTPVPSNGGNSVKQVEIDFGAVPVAEALFLITDASVSAISRLVGAVAYEAPTGKDLDELEMDELELKFGPGSGQFTLFARGRDGYVADKFKINYVVG